MDFSLDSLDTPDGKEPSKLRELASATMVGGTTEAVLTCEGDARKSQNGVKTTHSSSSISSSNSVAGTPDGRGTTSSEIDINSLSPWEKWMVEKTRQEREQRRASQVRKLDQKASQREERRKKQERCKRVEKVYRDWVRSKRETEQMDRQQVRVIEEQATAITAQKQKETAEKAKQCYKQWQEQKEREKKHQEQLEAEQRRQREDQEQKRKEQAGKAYQEWVQGVRKRGAGFSRSCWWRTGNDSEYHHPHQWVGPLDEEEEEARKGVCGRARLNITITKR